MKDKKLNELLAAVRREVPPSVPDDFASRVMRGLPSRAPQGAASQGLFELITTNFSRCAIAAAAAIAICAVVEIGQAVGDSPSIHDDVERICADWMLH